MEEKFIKNMAALLLGKAKMLQYHCEKCKSPLFEKDGKITCPVCEAGEKKPKLKDEKVIEILKKKRDELLKSLEDEDDPQKIFSLVEAIKKIEEML